MKRSHMTGPYWVGGDDRKLPTVGTAISLAQTLASHAGVPRQFGIFRDSERLGRVQRHEDGSVTTTMNGGGV